MSDFEETFLGFVKASNNCMRWSIKQIKISYILPLDSYKNVESWLQATFMLNFKDGVRIFSNKRSNLKFKLVFYSGKFELLVKAVVILNKKEDIINSINLYLNK